MCVGAGLDVSGLAVLSGESRTEVSITAAHIIIPTASKHTLATLTGSTRLHFLHFLLGLVNELAL